MFKKFVRDLKFEFKDYDGKTLSKDIMTGLTVAAVALPLALAFGVSSGANAASGLITAIFAGIFIASFSGASFQISGPTGAMAAILLPLSLKYGIKGVLTAGLLSGVILLIVASLKIGKLVSYIPAPVITGFTSGIAIVIAIGQIDNFFGTVSKGENAITKLSSYATLGFSPNWYAVMFGVLVVLIMVFYPKKWKSIVPSSLAAIIISLVLNLILFPDASNSVVMEVGAIPKTLISENALFSTGIDFANISNLILPAFSVALLGIIESLMCGASGSNMTGEQFDSNREIAAQGLGNILIPLVGGVPATAAIARTSVAIKAGGRTRLVSIVHSITLIASMFLLSGVMSHIPLASLAGVLMVTAFRMNEWESIKLILSNKFKSQIIQYSVTMICTVVFDLTIAIAVGILMAMLAFVKQSCELNIAVSDIDLEKIPTNIDCDHSKTKVAYLSGPIFFGTQEKLTSFANEIKDTKILVLSMRGVPSIDGNGIDALAQSVCILKAKKIDVLMCGVQEQVEHELDRVPFKQLIGEEKFFWDAIAAIKSTEETKQPA
ncbi:MAG: SulP family inorganic anion transporter [Erysipelotrichia bacterium]|nr:SulP family inorganic anion transporter [Erysipelotrichia bacterium]